MLQKRVIPFLLLRDGLFVKTIQFGAPKHISEPIYAIKIFNDYEVDELIIVDIMASRNGEVMKSKRKIPFELISKISDESCMPITYGGGISTIQEMKDLFRAGIEKVSLNTKAIVDPEFVQSAAKEFGSQSIVVSIDTKKDERGNYRIYTNCGLNETQFNPVECAMLMEKMGAGELIVNSIDRDGTMNGYDIPLIKKVSSSVNIPVIALGGAGSKEDLSAALHQGGASACAAGSLFVYFGKKKAVLINYPDKDELESILNLTRKI